VTRAVALVALLLPLAGAHRVGSAGVTVALPPGWHAFPSGVTRTGDHVTDPVTRVVVASAPISWGKGCNELDYRFAATGVAIVVVEWTGRTPATRWQPRPARFTSHNLTITPPPALECWAGPGGGVQFADHGRRFAAFVLLGVRAPPAAAREARAVLDTLRVRP
jgi:hypothetical protein